MNKSFHLCVMLWLAVLVTGGFANAIADDRSPLLYGFMTESDEWRDDNNDPKSLFGYYTFHADGDDQILGVSPIGPDNEWATYGGTYANGRFYGYSVQGNWMKYTLTFVAHDATTWQPKASQTYTYVNADKNSEESQKAYLVPADLAYDPINNIIYAAAKRYASQNDPYLCSVDPTTGLLTRLAPLSKPMAALTCSSAGKLLGVGIDGNLYAIALDGTCTALGHTGFYPNDGMNQSAACDYRSGYIYWACAGFASEHDRQWNENGVYSLMRIDPANGETKIMRTFPRDQRFSSLSIMNAHPDSPDDIIDFTFSPIGYESTEGAISFTVPAVTSVQNPISTPLTVRCYIDNELRTTVTANPGSPFVYNVTGLAQGAHTAAAEVEWNGHTGNRVYASAFFGFDTPAKIQKVTLSCPDGDRTTAVLSWDAPTTGSNGSAYDPEKIRYRVVRYPDNVIVKRSLRETTFTEKIATEYGRIYYVVTPYNIDNSGEFGRSTTSNAMMLGADIIPPYYETFDNASSMDAYTIIDVDGDGSEEWASPCWKYDEQYACAFYYGRRDINANDWLITPPLQLNPDKLYRLTYKYYGYYGYGNHFRVAIGNDATVEGMSREIQNIEKVTTAYDNPGLDAEVLFAVYPGDRFIGFHHISQNMEHLSIDNVRVEEAGDARIPAAVSDLTAIRLSSESYQLLFKVPDVTANGKTLEGKLTATIINNEKTVATLSDLTPGQNIEWICNEAVKGRNTIVVYITNNFGEGLHATTSVDLSDAVPQSVTGALATYINPRQVAITWDPITSEVGENGNPIDLDEIRYMVFKPISTADGTDYRMLARDLTDCRFVDDNPMLGCPDDSQQIVSYLVEPVNSAGEGYAVWTNGVVVGPSYTLPFAETWTNQSQETSPWMKTYNDGATWYIRHKGYDPLADGQDGYGVLSCEVNEDYSQGTAGIVSPRIDLTSMTNPELSFYYYRSPEYADGITLMAAVLVEGDNEIHYLPTIYRPKATAKGWEKATVSLADYADQSRVSIFLLGHATLNNTIHIDNFCVSGTAKTNVVRAEYLTGSAKCRENAPATFTATIFNYGAEEARNITATLKAGNATIATKTAASIAAGSSADVVFEFTPAASHVGTTTLTVEAGSGKATKEITVEAFNPAAVTDLGGAMADNGGIRLSWGLPTLTEKPQNAIDGFDAYDSFTISSMGGWTPVDGDGFLNFRFSDGNGSLIEWPNCAVAQAYIVFNPSELSVTGTPAAYSGQQYLVSWGSPYGKNNDWLISPELPGCKQMISLMARSFADGDDRFHIYVSRTGTEMSDFISLTGINPIKVDNEWNIYYFALPEGTRHFAIVNVSDRQDGLLIDDVMFYGNHNHYMPDGYNIYRNGTLLNSTPVTVRNYIDTGATRGGDNNYTVRAVYNGRESLDSNVFFTDGLTSIEGIATDDVQEAMIVTLTDGIEVRGAADNATVNVFKADGTLVAAATGNGHIALQAGVYIVKADTTVAKVVIR